MTLPALPPLNSTAWYNHYSAMDAGLRALQAGGTGSAPRFDNTGNTDVTAAVQAAINAIKAKGGVIEFAPGTYRIDGQLNLDSSYNVVLTGTGPQGADRLGPWNTTLQFGKSGSTACITARSSQGFTLDNLAVTVTNSAFTGAIVDVGSTGDPTPTYRPTFRNGYIGGASATATNARSAILLGQSVEAVIENMVIGRTIFGLIGRDTGETGFSNAVTIQGGRFADLATAAIYNPGSNWTVVGTVFEPTPAGAPAGIVCTSTYPAKALSLVGASFWDNTATGIWIDFWGAGLHISGAYAEVNAGATFCRLNGTVSGFQSVGGTIYGSTSSKYLAMANTPLVYNVVTGDAFFNGITDNTSTIAASSAFLPSYQPTLKSKTVTAGTTTLGLLNCGSIIICNAASGTVTVNMPNPGESPGSTIIVKKQDSSANPVSVYGFTLANQNSCRTFVSDGNVWHTTSIIN